MFGTKWTGTMVALALASVLGVGCGNLEDPSSASTDVAALSAAPDGQAVAACGAPHNPKTDRDHKLHKRCEHYQQKHPDRDSRAGNAHLTTRALMDKQLTTTIEATTASFDNLTAAPGRIDQLEIDVQRTGPGTHDARHIVAKSAQPSGYASTTVQNLVHGQTMSITAHVSGIGKGADVVSTSDEVRYRPDLVVGPTINVAAPPTAGVPTSIAATVREAKGDEGATADCVLSVDGVATDRASGIWVDAAGTVTCHFTTTFASAGAHLVAIDAVNVAPQDYDPTNNHAETTVQVAVAFSFSASVVDSSYTSEDIEDVLDGSGALAYHRDDTSSGRNQSESLSGTWPKAVAFPLSSVVASASSGGATWSLINLGTTPATSDDGAGTVCASGSDPTGYNWLGICSLSGSGGPATQISVSAFAGDVTYHSVGVCQTTTAFYDCAGGYTWNSGSDPGTVTFNPIAGSLTFGLTVVDAAGLTLAASPVVPMAPYTISSGDPRTCVADGAGEQDCTSDSYSEMGLAGSASQ